MLTVSCVVVWLARGALTHRVHRPRQPHACQPSLQRALGESHPAFRHDPGRHHGQHPMCTPGANINIIRHFCRRARAKAVQCCTSPSSVTRAVCWRPQATIDGRTPSRPCATTSSVAPHVTSRPSNRGTNCPLPPHLDLVGHALDGIAVTQQHASWLAPGVHAAILADAHAMHLAKGHI